MMTQVERLEALLARVQSRMHVERAVRTRRVTHDMLHISEDAIEELADPPVEAAVAPAAAAAMAPAATSNVIPKSQGPETQDFEEALTNDVDEPEAPPSRPVSYAPSMPSSHRETFDIEEEEIPPALSADGPPPLDLSLSAGDLNAEDATDHAEANDEIVDIGPPEEEIEIEVSESSMQAMEVAQPALSASPVSTTTLEAKASVTTTKGLAPAALTFGQLLERALRLRL